MFFIRILQLFVLTISTSLFAQKLSFTPFPLVKLDPFFSPYVLIAEKATHKLHLFKESNNVPELIYSYPMVTGKKAGNKQSQGDYRTPEGIYFIQEFIAKKELLARYGQEGNIYGMGAFTLDYPNPFDHVENKTGAGIWLHSTNDETRIEKGLDSRGCAVINDTNLKEVSNSISLKRTPFIIVHELTYVNELTLKETEASIQNFLNRWLTAWQMENLQDYIESYHPVHFKDSSKGRIAKFREYKKAVFSMPGKPTVELSNISILLGSQNYATVTFKQKYVSNTINDTGAKTLYLIRDEYYDWKIIMEDWTTLKDNEK